MICKECQDSFYAHLVFSVILILVGLFLFANDDVMVIRGTAEKFSCASDSKSGYSLRVWLNENIKYYDAGMSGIFEKEGVLPEHHVYYEAADSKCNEYEDQLVKYSKVVIKAYQYDNDILLLKIKGKTLFTYREDEHWEHAKKLWYNGKAFGVFSVAFGLIGIFLWILHTIFDIVDIHRNWWGG